MLINMQVHHMAIRSDHRQMNSQCVFIGDYLLSLTCMPACINNMARNLPSIFYMNKYLHISVMFIYIL